MNGPRQIRIHAPGVQLTDPGIAIRLGQSAPTAFLKAQNLLVATKHYLEAQRSGAGDVALQKVYRQLDELGLALESDGYRSDRKQHLTKADLLLEFLCDFSDAFPNWQEEYDSLNRLIPMATMTSEHQSSVGQYSGPSLPRSIQELAQQYRGTTLPQLIQRHIRSQSEKELLMGIRGTFDHFPPAFREPLDSYIQEYVRNWFGPHILTMDLSEIFTSTVRDIQSIARSKGLSLSQEMVFDVFNIMVMKISHFAHREKGFRKQLGIKKGLFW